MKPGIKFTVLLTGLILMISLIMMAAGCGSTATTTTPAATSTTTTQTTATTTATTPAATTQTATTTPAATSTVTTPAVKNVILATTTSTQDSGLLDVLIPLFEEKTGYNVQTIAVGTGAALQMGVDGEADVMLVHAPTSELPLITNGDAISRKLVMHNDFVIVGPPADPAGIKGMTLSKDAFAKIAETGSVFISRGDNSGTHKSELGIWKTAGVDPAGQSWYQQSGQGMGSTLTIASEKQGYTLTDRATYLATQANLDLDILVEGDPVLLNIYHVMQVNPEKNDLINGPGGAAFADFMISPEAQAIIAEFGVDKYGQPLFFPDADKTEADLGSV
jgi:tungstate transport system substrate-binding protein